MPANQKVSVAWQIVFTFIPIANFWAFYRIRKFTRYFLYTILPDIVATTAYLTLYFSSLGRMPWGNNSYFVNTGSLFVANVLSTAISWALQGLSIYLVIIWSRQHNTQFDQPSTKLE